MFDSVLGQGTTPRARFGAGTSISVLLHAGILGMVWFISTAPVDQQLPDMTITFYAAPPPPPPPPRKKARAERKLDVKKRDVMSPPAAIPTNMPPEVTPPPDEHAEPDGEGEEGGMEGGVPGGIVGPIDGAKNVPDGTDVVAFGQGMTRPERIGGRDPVYTREALEAHVQGLMSVKCIISTEGTLHGCRIIKPLPYMEKAVLEALATRRYRPVTLQGQPIACDYTFNIRLEMPGD